MIDEWEMKRRKAEAYREGQAKEEADIAARVVKYYVAEGQSKAEVVDELTRLMGLSPASAERYYEQTMAD